MFQWSPGVEAAIRAGQARRLTRGSIQSRRAHLVLGASGLGELEGDTAAGQLAVDVGVGIQAVVNTTTLLLVKDDLQGLGAVLLGAEALADDLDGVDEVGEDGVVDGGQSAGAGTLLLLGVARAGGSLGAGQDAARGEDQDVAVGELLLQLTGETMKMRCQRRDAGGLLG